MSTSFNQFSTTEVPRAGKKEWIGLTMLALPCLLYSMDLTVLNLAVPAISETLKPSSTELLWIVDIYGFMIAGFLITMGTLGDRIGRRKLLMFGAIAFGISSILASFSQNVGQLIFARALLGISGATLAPSTLSLISNMFHHADQRAFAIGIWTTSFSIGGAIGPVLGGVFLEHFWWGSVFLIGLPGMLILLIFGPSLLPEFRDPSSKFPDLPSAFLSLIGILSLIFGLKKIAQQGFGTVAGAAVAAGLIVLVIFVRRQRILKNPFIDLDLFKVPAFSGALVANTLSIFVVFGMMLYQTLYFQLVLELTPLKAGICAIPSSLGFIGGSMLAPVMKKHVRPGLLCAVCLAGSAVGFVLFALVKIFDPLTFLIIGSLIFAFGIAVVVTIGVDLVVGVAPPEKAGAASGVSETSTELGGALGIAIMGSIGTAIYRSKMEDLPLPGFSKEAASSVRSTFSAAYDLSKHFHDQRGDVLLQYAKASFTDAFVVAALLSAAIMAALAILLFRLLRDIR